MRRWRFWWCSPTLDHGSHLNNLSALDPDHMHPTTRATQVLTPHRGQAIGDEQRPGAVSYGKRVDQKKQHVFPCILSACRWRWRSRFTARCMHVCTRAQTLTCQSDTRVLITPLLASGSLSFASIPPSSLTPEQCPSLRKGPGPIVPMPPRSHTGCTPRRRKTLPDFSSAQYSTACQATRPYPCAHPVCLIRNSRGCYRSVLSMHGCVV